jgi:hypothetical protein
MTNNDNITIDLTTGSKWSWSELVDGWGETTDNQAIKLAMAVVRRFWELSRNNGWEVVWCPHTSEVFGRKELERLIPNNALDELREQATAEVFSALVYNDKPTDPAWIGEMVNKIFS